MSRYELQARVGAHKLGMVGRNGAACRWCWRGDDVPRRFFRRLDCSRVRHAALGLPLFDALGHRRIFLIAWAISRTHAVRGIIQGDENEEVTCNRTVAGIRPGAGPLWRYRQKRLSPRHQGRHLTLPLSHEGSYFADSCFRHLHGAWGAN